METTSVKLSALRALLGHVSPTLRSASIEIVGGGIHWKCEFDQNASEDDFELCRMAGGEILADFSAVDDFKESMLIVPFPEKCQHLEHLIYYRHEHNYYK
jgi:hypothetical protein